MYLLSIQTSHFDEISQCKHMFCSNDIQKLEQMQQTIEAVSFEISSFVFEKYADFTERVGTEPTDSAVAEKLLELAKEADNAKELLTPEQLQMICQLVYEAITEDMTVEVKIDSATLI